jgi:hypothetical protein
MPEPRLRRAAARRQLSKGCTLIRRARTPASSHPWLSARSARHQPCAATVPPGRQRVGVRTLPAADRRRPVQGEYRKRGLRQEPGLRSFGRHYLVDGNISPPFPLIPHFALAGVSDRGMWGMRGMFLVFARRRQVDSVGISAKLRRERDVCINIGSFDDCYLRSVLVPTLWLPKGGCDWWRRNTSLSFRCSAVRLLSCGV